ncbi:cobalamin-dependent protein, partial [Candidatus Bathyarchaeota archaeon]|nr:cobalamin-dependent protein [Candidatus Bathyarchaeota archaeon]
MKVALVNPPYPKSAHQHPPFISLGIGYLGAIAERDGHEVTVIDCQGERLSHEAFRHRLEKVDPDVVGITSATLTYKSALKIAEIAKEVCPSCVTILGGCHATFWDFNALNECRSLDIIVRKEGELTFSELLKKLEHKERIDNVQGITFRKRDKIVRNEDRQYIENLDDLPFPAHHLFNLRSYVKVGKVIIPVMTSRGCVYWCDFCTAVRKFGR